MTHPIVLPVRTPLVLVSLALLCLVSPLRGQDIQLLERASQRFDALDGLCASFEQRLQVPLLGTDNTSQGRLCQRPPHYFAMDFSTPQGDRIVADGEHLWVYYPSTQPGQVLRTSLSTTGAIDFYREFLADPTTKYAVTAEGAETVDGRTAQRFRLEPKQSLGYLRATVWIDESDALIRRVEIEQENGSLRRVDLTDLQLNPQFAAGTFTFDPPAGTRVMSLDGVGSGR